jgi:hypothetical protein
MPTKETTRAHSVAPEGADDLTRIRGIGPGIQQRLYAAGILSFERLAGLSAAELAVIVGDIAGMSAELISRKDWVGQARDFAEEYAGDVHADAGAVSAAPEVEAEEQAAPARQHYATFTVELLLGDAREVRRTRVRHVQGGGEDTWANWNAQRLVDFFVGQAGLEVAESAPEPATPQPQAVEAAPVAQPALAVRSLEVVPGESGQPGRFLAHGQPFEVRLAIDIEQENLEHTQPLVYALVVNAKDLRTHSHHAIGETQGALAPDEPWLLRIAGVELPRGIFRLVTAITVDLPASEGRTAERFTAFQEGQLFQVY